MYNWSEVLEYEPKIKEAYQMLRRQGIVKFDPVTLDRVHETLLNFICLCSDSLQNRDLYSAVSRNKNK